MASNDKVRLGLRAMLRDMFVARAVGTSQVRTARAGGYVDGYMRALLDHGLATQAELLRMVAEERAAVDGPALRFVDVRDPSEVAA